MKIYKYDSYGEYVAEQTAGNKKKINHVFVRKQTMLQIKEMKAFAGSVLCHGTRNGAEQKFFKEVYGSQLHAVGSEISDTATQFPDTVEWDFMKENPDWVGQFDIVYSNSLDHSFEPVETLKVWGDQLAPGGSLFIEHSFDPKNNNSRAMDPLELSEEEFLECLDKAGLTVILRKQVSKMIPLFKIEKK
jgi:hypothetical protein